MRSVLCIDLDLDRSVAVGQTERLIGSRELSVQQVDGNASEIQLHSLLSKAMRSLRGQVDDMEDRRDSPVRRGFM